jgi:hypothetical protein
MPGGDRKDLAVQALAQSAAISDLSARHGVSRKSIYQQANKARHALDDAFLSTATDDTVLFQVQVTKRWLRQVIVDMPRLVSRHYRIHARSAGLADQHRHYSQRAPRGR